MPDPTTRRPNSVSKELRAAAGADRRQKAQFFEAVVDVIEERLRRLHRKSDPAESLAAASREADHRQGLPVSGDKPSGLLPSAIGLQTDAMHRAAGGALLCVRVRLRQPRVGHLQAALSAAESGMMAGSRSGGTGCFRYWPSTACWCSPGGRISKTTHSFHRFYRHPNLLKAGLSRSRRWHPEQVWVADITYLPARSGPLYLKPGDGCLLTQDSGPSRARRDARRGRWRWRSSRALKATAWRRELIHHSDRGVQYCSGLSSGAAYERHGVRCSMTDGAGDCYQKCVGRAGERNFERRVVAAKPAGPGASAGDGA